MGVGAGGGGGGGGVGVQGWLLNQRGLLVQFSSNKLGFHFE